MTASPANGDYFHPPRRRRVVLPILLLLATAVSTFWTGAAHWNPEVLIGGMEQAAFTLRQDWGNESALAALGHAGAALTRGWDARRGLVYCVAVLAILLTHEMGHFLVALRHRIPASLPYFLPVPFLPFGTLGAVIGMEGSRANRRQMFDLGVAGPLAGLAVALPILFFGVYRLDAEPQAGAGLCFHNPLLLELMVRLVRPGYPTPDFFYINQFNPWLMAGWVGILVTGLNMIPVSQLDGGHVSYALLGRRAHTLARGLIVAAIVYIVAAERYIWVVMLILVILLGTDHPPTADDRARLGWLRRTIGWLAMTIPILCFPPLGIVPPE